MSVDKDKIRTSFLPFCLPLIGEEEEKEILDTLRSGWITLGPKTHRFEEMLKEYTGSNCVIAVSSCTAALHLSLIALGVGEGDEVITTPVTWPATANVIIHQRATPVFVDVERETLNIDVQQIEDKITPKTKAIIPVHLAGQPCDMDEILEIAEKHGLAVIEDAAHAVGAEYHGKKIGSISDFTCFSFYPIKNITTIEGGAIVAQNPEVEDRIRILSLHGVSKDAWKRYSSEKVQYAEVQYPGYKYNMTDIQASLGIHQLPKLDKFIEIRAKYARMYDQAFADVPELVSLITKPDRRHAQHLYIVLIKLEKLTISRDQFISLLREYNIGTGLHFISLHLQLYYRKTYGFKPEDLPNANYISQRIISLPLYPKMTETDVRDVIEAVLCIVRDHRR